MREDLINDSQFHMWRALFAIVHADGVVSDEEVRFMAEILEDIPFNDYQKTVLSGDVHIANDVVKMFEGITDSTDQAAFFKVAHKIVHIDGDYGEEEQELMLKLKSLHVQETNVDNLIGRVELQLEGEEEELIREDEGSVHSALYSFRDTFIADIKSRT